ncbi:MAG: 6-phosphogluconolactonase [Candidatus Dormibacteraeota bacterium]|uniref:6-phosphogluconolactonase n=1 Tax=Candidatus Amunia macphersoniae TaxID=3127014 RepID=A0A934KQX0_9BACT|nr:6-phosphogluconolactonase [Candidatus Dormibacteraeota bacterium]
MTASALPGEVRVSTDPIAVAAEAARWISARAESAERFRIAAVGGTTPHFAYEALASSTYRLGIDWSRWHVFFGDERAVPPGHPDSNYRLVHDTLLAKVPIPAAQVHRMRADASDLDAAAADYSRLLGDEGGSPPRLDVVLLGLGSNGHTASLFPGTPALEVTDAWATRGLADYQPADRITLTFPAINAAAHVAFLVTGAGKAQALHGVIEGTVPAARVSPADGEVIWFLDSAAARSLG